MARNKEIEIDTRLGRRCIDADKVVHFPRGLAGFENERDFILLQIRPDAPLLILQSVTTPVVGLLVADPYSFFDRSYAPQVGDAEKQLLCIESLDQAALLVTVSIPAGAPEKGVLNLTGPIIINYEARVGLQVPQCADGPQQVNMHSLKPVEAEDQATEPAPGEAAPACGCGHKDTPQK
jgi:flagellar assembly factor FliW